MSGKAPELFFLTPIPSLDIPRRQGWAIDTNIKDEYKRCPWPSRRKRSQIIKMLGQSNGGLRVQNIVQASVSSDIQVDSKSKKRSCAKSKRPLALSLLTEGPMSGSWRSETESQSGLAGWIKRMYNQSNAYPVQKQVNEVTWLCWWGE